MQRARFLNGNRPIAGLMTLGAGLFLAFGYVAAHRSTATVAPADGIERVSWSTGVRGHGDALVERPPSVVPGHAAAPSGPGSPRGFVRFLLASTGQPVGSASWTVESADTLPTVLRSSRDGLLPVAAGTWTVIGSDPYVLRESTVCVRPDRTSVVWVGQACDFALRVTSIDGNPVPGASVSWVQSDRLHGLYDALDEHRVFTDEEGRALSPGVRLPWATRILVSHPSYHPFQGTLETSCDGEAQAVTLTPAPRELGFAARLVDGGGRALPGVDVYAELVDDVWPEAYPLYLGRTGSDGTVQFADWIASAHALVFRGAAHPSRYVLGASTFAGPEATLRVPRSVVGSLTILGAEESEAFSVRVTGRDSEGSMAAVPLAIVQRHTGPNVSLLLPAARDAEIAVCTLAGDRSARAGVYAESDGWEREIRLEARGITLAVYADGDAIAEYAFDEAPWLPAPQSEASGEVVLRLPSDTRRVKLKSSTGATALLGRRCEVERDTAPVAFVDRYPVDLTFVDALGGPVRDVQVSLIGISGPVASSSSRANCWKGTVQNRFVARPDDDGAVRIEVPEGTYLLRIEHLPWRERLVFSIEAPGMTRRVHAAKNGVRQTIVVPRPRLLALELEGTAPSRWLLWDVAKNTGQVFFGNYARVWIDDSPAVYEIRDHDGDVIGSLEVPSGSDPLHERVHL